jgi:hypothetical protein
MNNRIAAPAKKNALIAMLWGPLTCKAWNKKTSIAPGKSPHTIPETPKTAKTFVGNIAASLSNLNQIRVLRSTLSAVDCCATVLVG